eukprot:CAMPEP_0118671312 /NCGR_PEP_ID=MMETSP0785-20121206/21935_1 /TAXON_ID=91992 /ORGANISM="Bolidomonas pacifica, Strain CCMP 1866" /LENGTH=194 /DNA_ID=CAMNT_0006566189 /DNA_START=273 /DNA_END=858 /DNA_ORIENTATION=+
MLSPKSPFLILTLSPNLGILPPAVYVPTFSTSLRQPLESIKAVYRLPLREYLLEHPHAPSHADPELAHHPPPLNPVLRLAYRNLQHLPSTPVQVTVDLVPHVPPHVSPAVHHSPLPLPPLPHPLEYFPCLLSPPRPLQRDCVVERSVTGTSPDAHSLRVVRQGGGRTEARGFYAGADAVEDTDDGDWSISIASW